MKQRGLGKGLSALLSDEVREDGNPEVQTLPIIDIEPNPNQPRRSFDEGLIEELSKSIETHGIIQPIIVKESGLSYIIIAGERRWRAAKNIGLKEIPVILKKFTKQESVEVALIENIQREDLNAIELAQAYNQLALEFELTQEDIAAKVGKSRSAVANIMRLLNLSEYVQEKTLNNSITYGHAKAILGVKEEEKQNKVADEVIANKLTVREVENLISDLNTPIKEKKKKEKEKELPNPFHTRIQEGLQSILGTKVKIKQGKKKGKIEIEYYSDEELERIINLIGKE